MWFLLRDDVKLGGDVTVTTFKKAANAILIGMVQSDEPDAGSVELELGDNPLELRQWTVADPAGTEVRVACSTPSSAGRSRPLCSRPHARRNRSSSHRLPVPGCRPPDQRDHRQLLLAFDAERHQRPAHLVGVVVPNQRSQKLKIVP